MLVLTRKAGEKIVLDGNIILTVVEVNGNRVKLAFEAPQDVVILRGELVDRGQETMAHVKNSGLRWEGEPKPVLAGRR